MPDNVGLLSSGFLLGDHAVRHRVAFSSCGLCSPRECRWHLGRRYEAHSSAQVLGNLKARQKLHRTRRCKGIHCFPAMGEPARDDHAKPRSHRAVLAPAGENDNDCLLTGGDHLKGKFDVKSSVTASDGGSRQWKQIEQLKTIAIGLRLILGKWVLHSHSHIQNERVRKFAGVAGNHNVVSGDFLRLILGKWVLHSHSHIQNERVREFAGVAGNHNVVSGDFHSETDRGARQRQ